MCVVRKTLVAPGPFHNREPAHAPRLIFHNAVLTEILGVEKVSED